MLRVESALHGSQLARTYIRKGNVLLKILAILLIVVGIAGLITGGFKFTTQEKVVDVGPLEVNKEKKHQVPIGSMAAIAAIAGGGLLLLADRRKV